MLHECYPAYRKSPLMLKEYSPCSLSLVLWQRLNARAANVPPGLRR
jgi:hypothetical protein